jgi:hypothetical protein
VQIAESPNECIALKSTVEVETSVLPVIRSIFKTTRGNLPTADKPSDVHGKGDTGPMTSTHHPRRSTGRLTAAWEDYFAGAETGLSL